MSPLLVEGHRCISLTIATRAIASYVSVDTKRVMSCIRDTHFHSVRIADLEIKKRRKTNNHDDCWLYDQSMHARVKL
eukprot:COSAG02_NODE_442_length_22243_cov_20.572887_18_plen_77_part_00